MADTGQAAATTVLWPSAPGRPPNYQPAASGPPAGRTRRRVRSDAIQARTTGWMVTAANPRVHAPSSSSSRRWPCAAVPGCVPPVTRLARVSRDVLPGGPARELLGSAVGLASQQFSSSILRHLVQVHSVLAEETLGPPPSFRPQCSSTPATTSISLGCVWRASTSAGRCPALLSRRRELDTTRPSLPWRRA